MTKYREDVYPAYLEVARGGVQVFAYGNEMPDEMPCIVFAWWHCGRIELMAMSHQSLQ